MSPLGGMKNPWYFNYGIAIHGAQNVPTHPASHGCVRMSNSLADVFPTLVEKGNAVYVWGYDGREPEGYTEKESLPSFNRPDPDATTTTTTTTTTVPPTTVAPPTTQAPATTPAPRHDGGAHHGGAHLGGADHGRPDAVTALRRDQIDEMNSRRAASSNVRWVGSTTIVPASAFNRQVTQ